MATMMAVLVFGGAAAMTLYALVATIRPQSARIAALLRGEQSSPRFEPLSTLVRAERLLFVGERVFHGADHQCERGPELVTDVAEEGGLRAVELGERLGHGRAEQAGAALLRKVVE